MRVAVLTAVPEEAKSLAHSLELVPSGSHRGLPFFGGESVVLVCSGAGPERARKGLETVLQVERPRAVIVAGVAGGLDPSLVSGELVVSDQSHRSWLRRVQTKLPQVRVGPLLTSRRVIVSAVNKSAAFRDSGALAVDMETEAVAEVCPLPWLGLRAISDTAQEDLPLDFNDFLDQRGRPHYWSILAEVARRPGRIPDLLRLGQATRRALTRLGQVLPAVIESAPC